MGRFLERADESTDGDSMDRYMSEVTEMFGEELFKLQQHAWDESKVELLIDNLHTAHRAWGDPLELPGSAPHGAPQPQQQ